MKYLSLMSSLKTGCPRVTHQKSLRLFHLNVRAFSNQGMKPPGIRLSLSVCFHPYHSSAINVSERDLKGRSVRPSLLPPAQFYSQCSLNKVLPHRKDAHSGHGARVLCPYMYAWTGAHGEAMGIRIGDGVVNCLPALTNVDAMKDAVDFDACQRHLGRGRLLRGSKSCTS